MPKTTRFVGTVFNFELNYISYLKIIFFRRNELYSNIDNYTVFAYTFAIT